MKARKFLSLHLKKIKSRGRKSYNLSKLEAMYAKQPGISIEKKMILYGCQNRTIYLSQIYL